MRLDFDRRLRSWSVLDGAGRDRTVLLGGSPTRVMKLSPSGSALVRSWMNGQRVGQDPAMRNLAARLTAAGVAHPIPEQRDRVGPPASLQVIIPVRDDPAGLACTLAALGDQADETEPPIIVVDDASAMPVDSPSTFTTLPTFTALRQPKNTGPAGARNAGAALCSSTQSGVELLAFVDAGVTITRPDLERLILHFNDPEVVGVAPRVRSAERIGSIAQYEVRQSPLDQGPFPGRVGSEGALSYVPSALLVVRRNAFERLGGFDQRLRYGEDVDLVWRLAEVGTVRYDPSVVASHPPRSDLRKFVSQRVCYGSSAEPLAQRHGARMTHVRTDPYGAVITALTLFGWPGRLASLALLALRSRQAAEAMREAAPEIPDAGTHGALLASTGLTSVVASAAQAMGRAGWPITAGLLLTPIRRSAASALAVGWLRHIQLREPTLIGLAILDDLAYGFGVWTGMLRTKSVRSIVPDIQFRSSSSGQR